jgi:hypothetical protein
LARLGLFDVLLSSSRSRSAPLLSSQSPFSNGSCVASRRSSRVDQAISSSKDRSPLSPGSSRLRSGCCVFSCPPLLYISPTLYHHLTVLSCPIPSLSPIPSTTFPSTSPIYFHHFSSFISYLFHHFFCLLSPYTTTVHLLIFFLFMLKGHFVLSMNKVNHHQGRLFGAPKFKI